jgi:hypothetical protein
MVDECDISQVQERFTTGEWSSAGLCGALLERIGEIDRAGPALRSVIEVNRDALTIAGSLDEERRRGAVRGPLHGVPVLIKDSIDTGRTVVLLRGLPGGQADRLRLRLRAGHEGAAAADLQGDGRRGRDGGS